MKEIPRVVLNPADQIWLCGFIGFLAVWSALLIGLPDHFGEDGHWSNWVCGLTNLVLLGTNVTFLPRTSFGHFVERQPLDVRMVIWSVCGIALLIMTVPFSTAIVFGIAISDIRTSNWIGLTKLFVVLIQMIFQIIGFVSSVIAGAWFFAGLRHLIAFLLNRTADIQQRLNSSFVRSLIWALINGGY